MSAKKHLAWQFLNGGPELLLIPPPHMAEDCPVYSVWVDVFIAKVDPDLMFYKQIVSQVVPSVKESEVGVEKGKLAEFW